MIVSWKKNTASEEEEEGLCEWRRRGIVAEKEGIADQRSSGESLNAETSRTRQKEFEKQEISRQ